MKKEDVKEVTDGLEMLTGDPNEVLILNLSSGDYALVPYPFFAGLVNTVNGKIQDEKPMDKMIDVEVKSSEEVE